MTIEYEKKEYCNFNKYIRIWDLSIVFIIYYIFLFIALKVWSQSIKVSFVAMILTKINKMKYSGMKLGSTKASKNIPNSTI